MVSDAGDKLYNVYERELNFKCSQLINMLPIKLGGGGGTTLKNVPLFPNL